MDTDRVEQENIKEASPRDTRVESNDEGKGSADPKQEEKKVPFPKRLWDQLELNMGMLILMSKGALPPVISLAIYQATPVAKLYTTIGYLAAIMSILSFAILPRSKFLQTMLLDIIGVCIGACIGLLTVYSSVQARKHTTPKSSSTSNGPSPGASTVEYNSSASAVSAIWLFVNLLVANAFRASRPQLQFPVIVYSIFANVSGTYAPQFANMAAGKAFIEKLLEAFLTGFAIATGVNLFVFPISSRDVVFKDILGYVKALQVGLKAQTSYLKVLENKDMFSSADNSEKTNATLGAEKLKAALGGIGAIHGKLHGDLDFAKKEVAFSKLDAKDLGEIFKLLKEIMLPMHGMGSVADIFERLVKRKGWQDETSSIDSSTDQAERETKSLDIQQWNEIFKAVHDPFATMTETLHEGLQHVLYTLELEKKPGKGVLGRMTQGTPTATDLEAQGGIIEASSPSFAQQLETNLKKYFGSREMALKIWSRQKGIELPEEVFRDPSATQPIHFQGQDQQQHKRDQQQLYLILYLEFLLYSTGEAILKLVKFADGKVESGVMKRRRLIVPGKRRMKKWFENIFAAEDSAADHTPDQTERGVSNIYVGDSLQAKRKDPEHLPPTNSWQRFGNGVRSISHVLRSPAVAFGFRVACATMSIAILAFLKQTQVFFNEQRLVWAMIMIAIGMTVTAGSGVFGFLARVSGTTIAMCMSLIIWYVAGGRGVPAGVFVLLYVAIFIELYFILKFPRFTPVFMITMVTQVLILGYELQVKKSGVKVAVSNGQLYYPIYELAPYRLATVSAGCFVGFIWLYFPYPITASSELRKDLGASLYLLANYYSCVRATIHMRLEGCDRDPEDKQSPAGMLEKARNRIFSKEMGLLAGLRQHSAFTNFEFTLGGKFPKKQYDTIIEEVQSILYYMALISYASRDYGKASDSEERRWLSDFTRVLNSVKETSEEITSMLALLSASVTNGSPLPPYLKPPVAFSLSDKLEALDSDILGINHIAKPGYASFAVTQVASSLVSDDLSKLIENVRNLVGEVNFTFYPLPPTNTSSETLLPQSERKGKRD